jgi:serine protease
MIDSAKLRLAAVAAALAAALLIAPSAQAAAPAGTVVVGYGPAAASSAAVTPARVVRIPAQQNVAAQVRRLRAQPGVRWAVPDVKAHASEVFVPNDPGRAHRPGGWTELQWNFASPTEWGVGAEEAWGNLRADGAAGGRGVIVAVLDTGVAYANRGPFRRSPDFGPHEFTRGYDFVAHNRYPNDRNGHGTFVASEIAEETNNGIGLTGLSYGVRIMPVRVLNRAGEGEASTIAEGVYYAVRHGAKVINMSLEFPPQISASDIPELAEAVRFAHRRGVMVVVAAGNEGRSTVDYPARLPGAIAVGATTEHGCLAEYSNFGRGLTLVAPGGGPDAGLLEPNCQPGVGPGRPVFAMTFDGSLRSFGFPGGYEGTSMAAPEVSATAALVVASRELGRRPSPTAVLDRIRATTTRLHVPAEARFYGAGLLDAAAATAGRPL